MIMKNWCHFNLHYGAHTVSDIALYQKVEKPTTTKMVQRLIELGYVESTPGENKRTKVIQLTGRGLEICDLVEGKINQLQSYLLEGTSEEEQLIATRLLKKLSEKLTDYKG